MYQFSGTELQARQKSIKKQAEINFSSFVFLVDVNWNQLGLRRISLGICFINAVRLSTWAIYKVQLNR